MRRLIDALTWYCRDFFWRRRVARIERRVYDADGRRYPLGGPWDPAS